MTKPESFIVRFLRPDGKGIAGVGTLVGPKHVVTCAHVVNTALGLDQRRQAQPDCPVLVDFPFLGGDAAGTALTARVAAWRPPPGAPGNDDIAGLVIEDDLPDGASPAHLAADSPQPDSVVQVFGFIPGRPNGGWVPATVRGRVANRRLQLDSKSDSALRVQPGFSGTPAIDNSIGQVVGIIAESAKSANDTDSYAVAADVLREAWPEVPGPTTGRPRTGCRKRFMLLAGATAAVTAAALLSNLAVGTGHSSAGTSAIAVGNFPDAIAVNPDARTAYITTWNNNSVSVINTATKTVAATVPVGGLPDAVAVDRGTRTAYIANADDSTVSVINTATNALTRTINVGHGPDGVAVDPATHTAYITNYSGRSVSVISTAADATATTPIATLTVGKYPGPVAVDPGSHTAYVANTGDNSISIINTETNTVTTTVPVGMSPYAIAFAPATHTAYITNVGGNSVLVMNTATDTASATITVGNGPDSVAVDQAAHTAYVANSDSNSVSIINTTTNSVTATVSVRGDPHAVAVDPVTHAAYVTNSRDGSVSIIHPGR